MEQETTSTPEVTTDIQPTTVESSAGFIDTVGEDYKSLVENKGFKSVDDTLKSYSNLEKMIGGSIRMPTEDSSVEAKQDFYKKLEGVDGVVKLPSEGVESEFNSFYNKLGRPEDKEGYSFGDYDNVFGSEILDKYKEVAHKSGLTQSQAQALVEFEASFIPSEEQLKEEASASMEKCKSSLEKVWGKEYDNRLEASKEVLSKYGEKYKEDIQSLKSNLGNNPAFAVMLSDLADSMQERGTIQGDSRRNLTPEEATQRINDLKSDRGFLDAYYDKSHPGRDKMLDKLNDLYRIKHGG
jgi:hypothetical protein